MNCIAKIFWHNLTQIRKAYGIAEDKRSREMGNSSLTYAVLRKQNKLPSAKDINQIIVRFNLSYHRLFMDQ